MNMMERINMMMMMVMMKVDAFLHDEEGDTNFISILVLLGIALALAGIFLGFKDQILNWVDTAIGGFFGTSAGR